MALFGEALIEEISKKVQQRHQELSAALGHTLAEASTPLLADSPLRRDLELLIRVANGESPRYAATKETQEQVEQALKNLLALLFGNLLQTRADIPDEFWQSDIGVLVSRVRWWLSPDDLITISNAAALAYGENTQANRMRIARAMDKGLLDWVPDPSVANPQQNRRVLRSQVERLRERSTLPS